MIIDPVAYLAVSEHGTPFMQIGMDIYVEVKTPRDLVEHETFWLREVDLVIAGINFFSKEKCTYVYRRRDDNRIG